MKRFIWCCLFLLTSVGTAAAQNPQPSVPTNVDILIIGPGQDPSTATPVATQNTSIGPSMNCNIATLPAPGPTPLVNPTKAYFVDPFNSGKFCGVPLPTGLPNNAGYQAVAVFIAPSCTVNNSVITPCPSTRSAVGIPPFNIQPILTQPVTPTGLVIRP